MSTYVTKQLRIAVAEDQGQQTLVFRRGDTETKFEAVADLNEAGLSKLVIPIPTTDKDLMEGQEITTGRLLYIETDTELLVKLADAADTGFIVKPLVTADASTKPGMLYLEGSFTKVLVTPAGVSGEANVIFGVAGA